jgi:hypothetical protein
VTNISNFYRLEELFFQISATKQGLQAAFREHGFAPGIIAANRHATRPAIKMNHRLFSRSMLSYW